MRPIKLLLLGASGQVGQAFLALDLDTDFELLTPDSKSINFTEPDSVYEQIMQIAPDIIVNTAAYTAVDNAESDQIKAERVNATTPGIIANACQALGIPLIHISTDYVFDGKGASPYHEDDTTQPINVYGSTKLNGEALVRQNCDKHLIVRTSWVFADKGANFVRTMLRLGQERDQLTIINDQIGSPTYAGDIAQAILKLIGQALKADFSDWGVYHFSSAKPCSWYEFAQSIFATGEEIGLVNGNCSLKPIPTSEYPTPAARPIYSVLDCSKIQQLGIEQPDWQAGLKRMLNYIAAEN
ncbi:dTDP-4-dehydrorhamnose reductase [Maricurvus nonylphenolicus]|uniref:dTDP-4-dehydrorhamnose reductase n=1 Tax=Maricurvus nonylphenolicus TaxID=1008307 RepID=UPI0036F1CC03